MPDHPVPQGDDIILPDGTVVGSWNGDDVKDLQVEVQRIIKEQKDSGADRNNLLIRFGIPHMDQTPDHLKNFIAYALWGVDKKGMCLTHRRADHFESLDKINVSTSFLLQLFKLSSQKFTFVFFIVLASSIVATTSPIASWAIWFILFSFVRFSNLKLVFPLAFKIVLNVVG